MEKEVSEPLGDAESVSSKGEVKACVAWQTLGGWDRPVLRVDGERIERAGTTTIDTPGTSVECDEENSLL